MRLVSCLSSAFQNVHLKDFSLWKFLKYLVSKIKKAVRSIFSKEPPENTHISLRSRVALPSSPSSFAKMESVSKAVLNIENFSPPVPLTAIPKNECSPLDLSLPPGPIIPCEINYPEGDNCPQELVPVQLRHEGNTCFLAAMMQIMVLDQRIVSILKAMKDDPHLGPLKNLMEQYTLHDKTQGKSVSGIQKLRFVLNKLNSAGQNWAVGQHDAGEALYLFYNAIEERLLPETKKTLFPSQMREYRQLQDCRDLVRKPHETELVAQQGKWINPKSKLESLGCVLEIKLPMTNNPVSIQKLVQDYFWESIPSKEEARVEILDSSNQISRFGIEQRRFKIETPPSHLLFGLNRRYFVTDNQYQKLSTPVTDISELMEIPEDYFENGEKAFYRLDGLILHSGDVNGGHYTAVVRRVGEDGKHYYFHCDDMTRIMSISKNEFLKSAPQCSLLFYVRVDEKGEPLSTQEPSIQMKPFALPQNEGENESVSDDSDSVNVDT